MVRQMEGFKKARKIAALPFLAAWLVFLVGNFLVVATVRLMLGCFIGYGALLAFSFAFLPAEWTEALWRATAELYAESGWFKATVITSFALCCLPVLRFWPGKSAVDAHEQEREATRLNDDLIASRQQDELRARLRA